jgi:hypothetical protein
MHVEVGVPRVGAPDDCERAFLFENARRKWGVFLTRASATEVTGRAVNIVETEHEPLPEVRFVMLAEVAPREYYAAVEHLRRAAVFHARDPAAERGQRLAEILP